MSELFEAIKRTPGNIVGGGVDLANLVLGALTGAGLKGFVEKPIGGSEQLNEMFGLKAPQSTTQALTETALGMINPTATAKGATLAALSVLPLLAGAKKGAKLATGPRAKQAGMIVPATPDIVSTLGIQDVIDRAKDMATAGKSTWAVGVESEKALRTARNPGEALSVFIGPDGLPRIKLDTANARIASKYLPAKDRYGAPVVSKHLQAAPGDIAGPEIPLSDILLHPSLYQLSPNAAAAKVQTNEWFDIFGNKGGYSEPTNSIQISRGIAPANRVRNDPIGDLLETLLHENVHLVQFENKLRTGGSDKLKSIQGALDEARSKGSFRTTKQLDELQAYLNHLAKQPDSAARDKALHNLYLSNYGEWEARQGSQYGRSLPMMNERGSTF